MSAQQSIYPKYTIYVQYEDKVGAKNWNVKAKRNYEKKEGIFFNVENKNGDMALFYETKKIADTL
ncbi:MAG: hypothetical protein ACJA1H_000025 [Glaciecola sp.]